MKYIHSLRSRVVMALFGVVCLVLVAGVMISAHHYWGSPAASTVSSRGASTFTDTSQHLLVSQPTAAVPNAADSNAAGLNATNNPQPSAAASGAAVIGGTATIGVSSAAAPAPAATPAPVDPAPAPTPRPCGCYSGGGRLCPLSSAGAVQPQIMCVPCGYSPSTPTSDAIACPIE